MKVLQKITEEQCQEIYNLIEKKAALLNLKRILDPTLKCSIYSHCSKKLEEVEKEYSVWWDSIIREYQLEEYSDEVLYCRWCRCVYIYRIRLYKNNFI